MLLYYGTLAVNITSRSKVCLARDSWRNSRWHCNVAAWPPSGMPSQHEQFRHYHPKFEGGKAVSAVVMPPQAHRELQGKQNKTKQIEPQ